VPPPPRLWRVVRDAISDFYFNAWRFLAANILIGALLVVVLFAAAWHPLGLLLVTLLLLPAMGTMRMATRLVRDFHTDLGEFADAVRRPWPLLGVGLVQLAALVVLVGDILIAATWRSWAGTILLVGAGYGLLALWTYALVAWPLLLDPERDGEPVMARLRLAFVVILVHPVRIGLFGLLVGGVLAISTALVAPILTFSVGVAWLAIARFVLPVADRIEGRATIEVEP
jgi:uncharacterized membrane protein YesL